MNSASFLAFIYTCSFPLTLFSENQTTESVFTGIYENKEWGTNSSGEGISGPGSLLSTTEPYRAFLQDFLKTMNIRSVIDVGCGDWEFSRAINWSNIKYTGYDIVKQVIKKNKQNYGTKKIRFKHANATEICLPRADLLICKDVLQHLPNEDVKKFTSQFHKFKYCLITNDVDPVTLSSNNPQIKAGEHRNLDLSQPPFSIKGKKVLDYWCVITHKVVFLISKK